MKNRGKIKLKDMFDGGFLTSDLVLKNLSFVFLFAFFFTFYIAIRYRTESTIKQIGITTAKIERLQDKASEQRSLWQQTTLMIEVADKLQATGVKIPTEPIKQRIIIKKEEHE
ncbi:MAG: hypothetical protein LBL74_02120 [Bacteroidales bacterium]|jgi:hypothetical protein|nr:hypothetical protein [Bacteroidales bacterium]